MAWYLFNQMDVYAWHASIRIIGFRDIAQEREGDRETVKQAWAARERRGRRERQGQKGQDR